MSFHLNPWFWITLVGTPEIWLGIAGGVVVFYVLFRGKLGKRRTPVKAFFTVFVISLLLVSGMVTGLKSALQIERPCGEENPYCDPDFSFPSGHAATVFVFFTSLLLFVSRKWLPLLIIPLLVASSRAALGVHTIPDILVGSVVGIVVTFVVWGFLHRKGKI